MKSPVATARGGGSCLRALYQRAPYPHSPYRAHRRTARPAFTLVEVLIATAITLLLMAGIVTLFGTVSESVSRGQAMMETGDRLRGAQHRLQTDLKYITAPMRSRLDPREGKGYVEIVEGPGAYDPSAQRPLDTGTEPINTENGGPDTTVGDNDDMIMFTVRSYGEPFVGRWDFNSDGIDNDGDGSTDEGDEGNAIQSQVAEVCWFVRGTTLYRRVLLVVPERTIPTAFYTGMYYFADVSAHQEGGSGDPNLNWGPVRLVANSLGDLTKRENRYAHWPRHSGDFRQGFPHQVDMWGQLGLPTLRESSDPAWPFPLFGAAPSFPPGVSAFVRQNDYWVTPHPWVTPNVDVETGSMIAFTGNRNPERMTEDVILNNVLSFDVKVWDPLAPVLLSPAGVIVEPGDPGYRLALSPLLNTIIAWVRNRRPANTKPAQIVRLGAYVDLHYRRGINNFAPESISDFSNAPSLGSGLARGTVSWDTSSTHYEHDGANQDGDPLTDEGTDGLNNDPSVNRVYSIPAGGLALENALPNPPGVNGGVDDEQEQETAPPYDAPIRSIQIKIRVFDRDSRQIREVTVTQDFVP